MWLGSPSGHGSDVAENKEKSWNLDERRNF